jgi:hypothetical protein
VAAVTAEALNSLETESEPAAGRLRGVLCKELAKHVWFAAISKWIGSFVLLAGALVALGAIWVAALGGTFSGFMVFFGLFVFSYLLKWPPPLPNWLFDLGRKGGASAQARDLARRNANEVLLSDANIEAFVEREKAKARKGVK